MELNRLAPDFELADLDGAAHRLSDHRGRIVIINFWSCECPHAERTDHAILALCVQWPEDLVLLSIDANRIESPQAMAVAAGMRRVPLVLVDRDHVVADLYEARTTPHVFVIDRVGILRYRGAVDDTSFGRRKPTRSYLDEAIEALLAGQRPVLTETAPFGCAIVREAVE
jgi:thiol-disulfide isomerase/thioredoxin